MIDLHTHTILSDGVLLPSELVRRAYVNGIKAIAITDHVDYSNISNIIKSLVEVSEELNKYWDILVIPGVEITHAPVEAISDLVEISRGEGAKIVIVHGESPVEPVIEGTNRAAIEAGADIIAHPGNIKEEDALAAAKNEVYLEITTRSGHALTNKHVFEIARKASAKLVLNTDSHAPEDILTIGKRDKALSEITGDRSMQDEIISNSLDLLRNKGFKC